MFAHRAYACGQHPAPLVTLRCLQYSDPNTQTHSHRTRNTHSVARGEKKDTPFASGACVCSLEIMSIIILQRYSQVSPAEARAQCPRSRFVRFGNVGRTRTFLMHICTHIHRMCGYPHRHGHASTGHGFKWDYLCALHHDHDSATFPRTISNQIPLSHIGHAVWSDNSATYINQFSAAPTRCGQNEFVFDDV